MVPAQPTALFPAHGLQHLVANVVTVQAILCWLLVVPVVDQTQTLSTAAAFQFNKQRLEARIEINTSCMLLK